MPNETILVVEDDHLNLKLCRSILEMEGFKIIAAMEAEEGLKLAHEHHPDLILMDIQLPGMDGLTATGIIKKDPNLKDIPVIALTAHAMDGDDLKAYAAGCSGYITKPIEVRSFSESIRQWLKGKATASDHPETTTAISQKASRPSRYQKNILIVDDELLNRKLLSGMLASKPYDLTIAATGREALAKINEQLPDIILLDIMMPDMDGYEVTKLLKNNPETLDIPIILITALTDYQSKIKGLEAGFDDYLIKPVNFTELKVRIKALLKKKAYIDQLQNKYHAVFQQAISDSLTGLYNNAYCKHFLKIDLQKAKRQGYPISLIMADLDNFKQVNDEYGHITGDLVLKEVATILTKTIRLTDVAARYGGEEFALILPYADPDDAIILAERILAAIRAHSFTVNKTTLDLKLTISLGLATYPDHAASMTELFERADQALYKAKEQGKDCWTIFQPSDDGLKQPTKTV